ncbi:MAG: hypothetical protein JSR17_13155 [Proteobacteria bacterium]|nr:hypothetical protein [Pseudomonadota bacterium]
MALENINKIDADLIQISVYIQDYLVQIAGGAHIHNKSVSDQVSRFLIPYAETQLGFIADAQEAGLKEVQTAHWIMKLLSNNEKPAQEDIQDELNILHDLLHAPGRQIAGYGGDSITILHYNATSLIKICTRITLLHNLCGNFNIIQNFIAQNQERVDREFPELKNLTQEWLMAQFNAVKRVAHRAKDEVGGWAPASNKPFPNVGGENLEPAAPPMMPAPPMPAPDPYAYLPARHRLGSPVPIPASPPRHNPDRGARYHPWDGGYGGAHGGIHGRGYGGGYFAPPPPPPRRPWRNLFLLLAMIGITLYGLSRFFPGFAGFLSNVGAAMSSALSTFGYYFLAPLAYVGNTVGAVISSGLSTTASILGTIVATLASAPILTGFVLSSVLILGVLFARPRRRRHYYSHGQENNVEEASSSLASHLRQQLGQGQEQVNQHDPQGHARPVRFQQRPYNDADRLPGDEPLRRRQRLR